MNNSQQLDHEAIRIVTRHHDPRAEDKSGSAPWDYSIYPDLTPAQREAFENMGATLYMIQLAEHAIKTAVHFILPDVTDFSLDAASTEKESSRKRTLGQLLREVRKTSQLHPQFDEMLDRLLLNRNTFVHEMFSSPEYGLQNEEVLERTNAFLNALQDDAWNVQNVFLGCLSHWLKAHGIWEHLPESFRNSEHFAQLDRKGFQILVKKKQEGEPKTGGR